MTLAIGYLATLQNQTQGHDLSLRVRPFGLCMRHSRTLADGTWRSRSRLLSALGFYLSDETGELFADLAQLVGRILGCSRQSFFGAGMSLWVRAGSEIRLKKSLFTATSRFLVGHDFLLLTVGRRSLPRYKGHLSVTRRPFACSSICDADESTQGPTRPSASGFGVVDGVEALRISQQSESAPETGALRVRPVIHAE